MPGIVCQGDKRLTWAKYAVNYTEVAGTSSNFKPYYSTTKKAASAYTIQNGVFTLTNSATKTAENIAVGDYLVNVSTSNNSSASGSTLYKVTKQSGRPWYEAVGEMWDSTELSGSSSITYFTSYTQRESDGYFVLSGNPKTATAYNVTFVYANDASFKNNVKAGTYSTLYRLHQISGKVSIEKWSPTRSNNVTITYTPYTLSGAKGAYIGEVKANEGTYPENGIKDGYWYVLLN